MVAAQSSLLATLATVAVSNSSNASKYARGVLPYSMQREFRQQLGLGDLYAPCNTHVAGSKLKDAVDHESIMAPIRSQGTCGSCYAFAAIATMEAAAKVDLDKKVRLSEQQLIDCAAKDMDVLFGPLNNDAGGCGGGLPNVALMHFTQGGFSNQNPAGCACNRSSYPYASGDHPENSRYPVSQGCQLCECALDQGSVNSCWEVRSEGKDHVAALKDALNDRPVAVTINATALVAKQFLANYTGGVVPAENVKCGGFKMDHAVVAVGYGTDADGTEYWKIRNSWGAEWGEKGYIRVAIVDDDEGSLCINTQEIVGVYPKMIDFSSQAFQV